MKQGSEGSGRKEEGDEEDLSPVEFGTGALVSSLVAEWDVYEP